MEKLIPATIVHIAAMEETPWEVQSFSRTWNSRQTPNTGGL